MALRVDQRDIIMSNTKGRRLALYSHLDVETPLGRKMNKREILQGKTNKRYQQYDLEKGE